jgi:hypothetical protein
MEGEPSIRRSWNVNKGATGWQGDLARDLATYRLLRLALTAVENTGKQEDIAERIGRNADLLVHLSDEGFSGLIPQAILESSESERLFLGRLENKRNGYLMFCRTADFEAAVQLSVDEARHDLVAAHMYNFRGDEAAAATWADALAERIAKGELKRKPEAAAGHGPESPRERVGAKLGTVAGCGPRNRHRYKRSSVFCAGKIRTEEGTIDCDVLNISASGAQIRVIGDAELPARFTLMLERFGNFACEIVRQVGNKYGVTFEETPDEVERIVEEVINHPERTNEIRKYPRRLVLLSGAIYIENRPIECRVLDLSAGGAHIRVDEPFEHQKHFPLMIYRFGEFPSEVAWEKDTDLGIIFIDDPSDIERIIGHLLPPKGGSPRRP